MPVRVTVALIAALLVLIGLAGPAAFAADRPVGTEAEAARELAEKYVPILMIREQGKDLCKIEVEQYGVMTVDALFDNPGVVLKKTADGSVIKKAPKVEDIADRGEEAYIDLPGDPLGDTCVFSRAYDGMRNDGRAPSAVYAHIAREEGRKGLAVQYWFYWYFNQFNDLHESDWEGMQITFDAETPSEALKQEPTEMILNQHGGGERADWHDDKVEKEGDHPVVYPAAGSHATFYQSAVYPQNGWNGAGVGCDNTSEPLSELRPVPVLLPDERTNQGEFAWLSFDGRWGQKEKSFNNGPTGPQTKDQWDKPFTWMEQQRRTSPRMPGGGLAGPDAVNAFCGVMQSVTGVMNLQQADPLLAYALIAAFLLIVFLVFGYSKWRPADPDELESERAYGQIAATSFKLYRRHWKEMAVLGAIAIPIVGGTQLLGGMLGDASGGNGLLQTVSDIVLGVGRPVAQTVVSAFVIVFIRELVREQPTSIRGSLVGTWERFWRVVIAKLLSIFGVVMLAMTVIGIPFALRFLVTWTFVQQEVLFTDRSIRESFTHSTNLVRGHWWRTVRTMVPLLLILTVMGPLLGLALIFTPLPLLAVNLIGSVVFAVVIPFVTTGTTLLYFDLQARARQEGLVPRRSWVPWRPKAFGKPIPRTT